jgi:hypothetical protein
MDSLLLWMSKHCRNNKHHRRIGRETAAGAGSCKQQRNVVGENRKFIQAWPTEMHSSHQCSLSFEQTPCPCGLGAKKY